MVTCCLQYHVGNFMMTLCFYNIRLCLYVWFTRVYVCFTRVCVCFTYHYIFYVCDDGIKAPRTLMKSTYIHESSQIHDDIFAYEEENKIPLAIDPANFSC